MAIDLPPVLPPVLADQAQVEALQSNSGQPIIENVADTPLKIYGNRHLSEEDVRTIVSGATTPSDAIISLTRRYYESGNLLMKVHYIRSIDSILVFVDQLTLTEVKGDPQAVAHFRDLEGDSDLTIAEFDRERVLADLQATRAGYEYSISYEEGSNNDVAMVFNRSDKADAKLTEFVVEANNKGSRFLGRYFGLAGVNHSFKDGTKVAAAYQTAFTDLGESRDGEELNQYSLSVDKPFTTGLYGVDLGYIEYERKLKVDSQGATSGAGLTDLLGDLPLLGDVCGLLGLCGGTGNPDSLGLDAEITQFALRGEQVLFSTPWQRLTLNQRLEHVDSTIEVQGVSEKLLDEEYQVAELGAKYSRTSYQDQGSAPSQFSASLKLRAGFGDGGTLDDYPAFRAAYESQFPGEPVPEVVAQARTAEFIALRPEANYQLKVADNLAWVSTAKAQFADEQVPQQQQFILGGMDTLSAYLPGILVGDEGYFVDTRLESRYSWNDFIVVPSVFVEYGGAWYNNASSPEGDEQTIGDAGLRLKVNYKSFLYTEIVAARPVYDDVANDDRLDDLEADFYWRVRATF